MEISTPYQHLLLFYLIFFELGWRCRAVVSRWWLSKEAFIAPRLPCVAHARDVARAFSFPEMTMSGDTPFKDFFEPKFWRRLSSVSLRALDGSSCPFKEKCRNLGSLSHDRGPRSCGSETALLSSTSGITTITWGYLSFCFWIEPISPSRNSLLLQNYFYFQVGILPLRI